MSSGRRRVRPDNDLVTAQTNHTTDRENRYPYRRRCLTGRGHVAVRHPGGGRPSESADAGDYVLELAPRDRVHRLDLIAAGFFDVGITLEPSLPSCKPRIHLLPPPARNACWLTIVRALRRLGLRAAQMQIAKKGLPFLATGTWRRPRSAVPWQPEEPRDAHGRFPRTSAEGAPVQLARVARQLGLGPRSRPDRRRQAANHSTWRTLTLVRGPAMKNRFMLAPLPTQQSEPDGTVSDHELEWLHRCGKGD